jgi:putative membrane protein
MMMGRGYGFEYGSFGCGIFLMILILLIIGIAFYFINKNKRRGHAATSIRASEALVILNERLAKGEITQEEYEKIKKVISN